MWLEFYLQGYIRLRVALGCKNKNPSLSESNEAKIKRRLNRIAWLLMLRVRLMRILPGRSTAVSWEPLAYFMNF
jgi:hypothetical protein